MRVFSLPRHVTQGATLAGRTAGPPPTRLRRSGVSRTTLYRWEKPSRRNRLEPWLRRPHSLRGRAWSADPVSAVREPHADYPMGARPRDRRLRPRRQADLRPSLAPRQRTQRQVLPRQTPGRPALPRLPIQVDSGSEFRADFERECRNRSIDLFERPPRSPQLSGHVERNNGAWRYEFHASWDLPDNALDDLNRWIDAFADGFNTFRPPQALDGQTSAHYLQSPTVKETPSYIPNEDIDDTGAGA